MVPSLDEIKAYYKSQKKDPIKLGQMFVDAAAEFPSYQSFSTAIGILPGTVSHYVNLLRLPEEIKDKVSRRKIKFKVARCFSRGVPRDRVAALMEPFVNKTLSSVYAEPYVALVKKHPEKEAPELQRIVQGLQQIVREPEPEPVVPEPPKKVSANDVRASALNLIGNLMLWEPDSQIDTLLAKQSLKKLAPMLNEVGA